MQCFAKLGSCCAKPVGFDADLPISTQYKVLIPPATTTKYYHGLAYAFDSSYTNYQRHFGDRLDEETFRSTIDGLNRVISETLSKPWWERDVEEAADNAIQYLQKKNRMQTGVFWRLKRRKHTKANKFPCWLEVEATGFLEPEQRSSSAQLRIPRTPMPNDDETVSFDQLGPPAGFMSLTPSLSVPASRKPISDELQPARLDTELARASSNVSAASDMPLLSTSPPAAADDTRPLAEASPQTRPQQPQDSGAELVAVAVDRVDGDMTPGPTTTSSHEDIVMVASSAAAAAAMTTATSDDDSHDLDHADA